MKHVIAAAALALPLLSVEAQALENPAPAMPEEKSTALPCPLWLAGTLYDLVKPADEPSLITTAHYPVPGFVWMMDAVSGHATQ